MMTRKNEAFVPMEYEDILTSMDINQLIEEEAGCKERIKELQNEVETNKNMVEKFIDNPAMEHLLDMSIRSSATEYDVCLAKLKLDMIQKEIKLREDQASECEACKV